jgi:hypothetical protein
MTIFIPDDLRPHVESDTCGRCRKKFQRGDRLTTAFIFDRRGLNPLNLGNTGAMLNEEFELVHIDCHDPLLKKGLSDV